MLVDATSDATVVAVAPGAPAVLAVSPKAVVVVVEEEEEESEEDGADDAAGWEADSDGDCGGPDEGGVPAVGRGVDCCVSSSDIAT